MKMNQKQDKEEFQPESYLEHTPETGNAPEGEKNRFINGILTGVAASIIVGAICFSLWTLFGARLVSGTGSSSTEINFSHLNTKLKLLEQYIYRTYLEGTEDVDFESGIYKGLLSSLEDPYSTYYTEEEYAALMESTSGSYYGIGAYVSQDVTTGIIRIAKPFVNGPAYEAGVLPGDVISKIEGVEVDGMDLTEVVNLMKGEENTKVSIEFIREGEDDPIVLSVERRKVEVPTIEYEMLDDHIGYIAVAEFDEVTANQYRAAIDDLEKQGMKGLVVDLRNNPGGLLSTVVDMLDRMVDKGMLVYTKDKNGQGDEYKATDNTYFDQPLAVLINGNSASASEVFAGAIQDYGIGKLVGTTSFGKGIVQNIFGLSDGSAIKLTVSKYYTPNGRNIHGTGIDPDVEVELDDELKQKVTIEKKDDNQLQKAIEVIKEEMK